MLYLCRPHRPAPPCSSAPLLIVLVTILFASPLMALQEPTSVPTGLFNRQDYQEFYGEFTKLGVSRLLIEERIKKHNRKCRSVDPEDAGLISRCQASASRLEVQKTTYKKELAEYEDRLRRARRKDQQVSSEIQKLVSGIYEIKVPPPIPAKEASITFGKLPEGDKTSARVLMGLDLGIAVIDMAGRIGEKTMPVVKVIVVTGKIGLAAADGADVYITKKNDVYENILKYLKKPETAREFNSLAKALKAGKPIPEDADIEMVRAVKAMLDPRLGNSGRRMVWNAMMSPEAKSAALTQAVLETFGHFLGDAAGGSAKRILALRNPAYKQAAYQLNALTKNLPRLKKFPKAKASVLKAIEHANRIIEESFTTSSVTAKGLSTLNGLYQGPKFQRLLEEWTQMRRKIEAQ